MQNLTKSIICYIVCVPLEAEEIWAGNARLYDDINQYQVTCRLTKEMVVNTHSDYACEKQISVPRGEKRDWRGKGNIYTPQKAR